MLRGLKEGAVQVCVNWALADNDWTGDMHVHRNICKADSSSWAIRFLHAFDDLLHLILLHVFELLQVLERWCKVITILAHTLFTMFHVSIDLTVSVL